jgi:hypothetical protein
MSATPKIPEALLPYVIARHHEGWSLRRIATWLTEEKQLAVSRTAVSSALVRSGEPDPEPLDDARSELVDHAPTNLQKLEELQQEAEQVAAAIQQKSIERDAAMLVVKLLAQRERILLWKLRTAGLRAPHPSDPLFPPAPRRYVPPARPAPREPPPPPRPVDRAPPPSRPVERTPPAPVKRTEPEAGRNAPCPCGSGQKYKKCHGGPNPPSVTHAVTDGAPRAAVTR